MKDLFKDEVSNYSQTAVNYSLGSNKWYLKYTYWNPKENVLELVFITINEKLLL